MSVARRLSCRSRPRLEEARELARDYNVIPLRHTFIDDIETPVSAFLKLRGRGPAFLLESAEQGQRFGRYSFLGFRPAGGAAARARAARGTRGRRDVGSWTRRTRSAPWRTTCRATASRRSRACRRSRAARWACSATTSCARSSACRSPNPDDVGTPDMALMVSDALVVFDHLSHQVTILVNAFVDDPDEVDEAYAQAVGADRARPRAARRAGPAAGRRRRPRPADPAARLRVEHDPGGVRGGGRAGEGLHLRGRRLPGRPFAALDRALSGRGLLGLPRAAGREPVALHVLPRVRRLRDRGRLAGAAGEGDRPPRRGAPDRGHAPAGGDARGGPARRRRAARATRRSAPST